MRDLVIRGWNLLNIVAEFWDYGNASAILPAVVFGGCIFRSTLQFSKYLAKKKVVEIYLSLAFQPLGPPTS